MSQKKYLVTLTTDERDHLTDLLGKGKASALVRAIGRAFADRRHLFTNDSSVRVTW